MVGQARVVMCPDDTQTYPSGFTKGPCYQSYFKAMVVFGDSWTENGDAPLNPSSYAENNFDQRAINGPTWAEYLAASSGIDLYDFAASGATANNSNLPRPVPDAAQQIESFTSSLTAGNPLPFVSTLYAIWFGVNDMHDTYTNVQPDERDEKLVVAADSILNAITTLYQGQGARRFLVALTPPIGYLPTLTNGSTSVDHDEADNLAQNFNQYIVDRLQVFYSAYPDAEIITFNSYALVMDMIQNPNVYSLSNSIEACVNSDGSHCSDPDQYLWWDGWHPTTKTESDFAAVLEDFFFKGRNKRIAKHYVKTSFKHRAT
ncbi:GDSL-like Lipase/Acylhydrolase-domain-containing protein [Umbelopsis sp. AD052]|nr:GDSL-like Lipase/Acylhydrolase-domain-containing protein [Umbelopsis sp. AD052]